MLTITIPAMANFWDEMEEHFVSTKEETLYLEHSLSSVSKWEEKFHKAFSSKEKKTYEEIFYYIQCMTLNDVDPKVYQFIPESEYARIQEYIEDPHTATTIRFAENDIRKQERKRGGVLTAEVIYYYMITLGIPFECEKWHLNKLITMINVCNEKNKELDPKHKKKRSAADKAALAAKYNRLNEERRAKLGSKG